MRWTAVFVKYADSSVKDISLITAVIVFIDRDDSDLMTFKELDRLARGRRFSSGGTDLCTRALIGVKLENLEGGRSNMITVTGNSKVSEVFDIEALRRKPIVWFELESLAVKDTAPKTVQTRKSNLAPSCKESNSRADHIKIAKFVDPPSQAQSAGGRSIQFDLKAKPNIEGVLAAIGLSSHLASRIARSNEVPKSEILRRAIKSGTVEELSLPQKVADDSERVIKNEEVYKEMPWGDNWYDDDGHKYVMDGSGNCHDDDYCGRINSDDGQQCDDYDSRNCDNASEVDDDDGSANSPQINVAEEIESCKIKSETVMECVQTKASSEMSCNASGANAREIIVIDDDDDDSEDEDVLPVKDSARTECRKRNRKEFEIITKDHDIYNIDDDDDDEEEGESESGDDDMHTMAQITHTASSSDVKRHRGGGSTSSSRTAQSEKATASVTTSSKGISKPVTSVYARRPASISIGSASTACTSAPAVKEHVLHDTLLMAITRHRDKEQEPCHLSPVTNEEVNDCVLPRPPDIALESPLTERRNEEALLEENHVLYNPPPTQSECQTRCSAFESGGVDTHLDDSLDYVDGVTAAQSLQKIPQDSEPKNTFFGKAIMEFSMRQYDTLNRMINGH